MTENPEKKKLLIIESSSDSSVSSEASDASDKKLASLFIFITCV